MTDINKTNTNSYDEEVDNNQKVGCCGWFCAELCGLPMFSVRDPNGKQLDMERSFRFGIKYGSWLISLLKFILFCICTFTYIWGFFDYEYTQWYMTYVSYWTLLYTCIYLFCSFILSLMKHPSMWIINITWVMFLVVTVKGIVVVLLFWGTEYDWSSPDPPTTFKVMSHGVTWLCAMIDGMIINKIPIRLKHYYFVLGFTAMFMIWTVIQGLIPIDNPWTTSEDNTERLYNIVDWQNDPVGAAIVSAMVLFVALPIFSVIFWSISLCYRKYRNDNDNDRNQHVMTQPDIEVGEAEEEEGQEVMAQTY